MPPQWQRTPGGGLSITTTDPYWEWDRLNRMIEVASMFAQKRQRKRQAEEQKIRQTAELAMDAMQKGYLPPEAALSAIKDLKDYDPTAYEMYRQAAEAAREGYSEDRFLKAQGRKIESQYNKALQAFYKSIEEGQRVQQQYPGIAAQGPPMQLGMEALPPTQQAQLLAGPQGVGGGLDPAMFGAQVATPPFDWTHAVGSARNVAMAGLPGASPDFQQAAMLQSKMQRTPQQIAAEATTHRGQDVTAGKTALGEKELAFQQKKFAAEQEAGGPPGKGYTRLPRRVNNVIDEALDQVRTAAPGVQNPVKLLADNALDFINSKINEEGLSKSEALDEFIDELDKYVDIE